MEKAREFQKNIYFCFIDYAKAFDCVDHNKLENSERDGNTRPPDLPLEEFVCRSDFFWAPKPLQMVTAAMKLKDICSLEGRL